MATTPERPEADRAGIPQRADAARLTEPGAAPAAAGGADPHRDPGRAGHRAGREVDAELVLGEPPAGGGRDLGLHHRRAPLPLQPGQIHAGAVGAVAIDHPRAACSSLSEATSPSSMGPTTASPVVAVL